MDNAGPMDLISRINTGDEKCAVSLRGSPFEDPLF